MAKNIGLKDGIVLGALAGLALSWPKLSVWTSDMLANIIPASWQFLESFSVPFYGIIIGGIIGLIVDRT